MQTSPAVGSAAIRAVHTITTGIVEQHKEHRFGTQHPLMWWVLTSRSWVPCPINAFLIDHRNGPVLFDLGLDPAIASDPGYISSPIGRFLLRRLFKLHISPEDGLAEQLEERGFRAADVQKVMISHLHFDHIGGLAEVPQAEILVSAAEWAQLRAPHPERDWILREHIELPGANWRPVEFSATDEPLLTRFGGCHDVMGDGSMLLVPTPGHTPGSMSLLLRNDGWPPILLVGDLTYEPELLMNDRPPGIGDAEQLRTSYAKVRHLKAQLPDLLIVPSHDALAARSLDAVQSRCESAAA